MLIITIADINLLLFLPPPHAGETLILPRRSRMAKSRGISKFHILLATGIHFSSILMLPLRFLLSNGVETLIRSASRKAHAISLALSVPGSEFHFSYFVFSLMLMIWRYFTISAASIYAFWCHFHRFRYFYFDISSLYIADDVIISFYYALLPHTASMLPHYFVTLISPRRRQLSPP